MTNRFSWDDHEPKIMFFSTAADMLPLFALQGAGFSTVFFLWFWPGTSNKILLQPWLQTMGEAGEMWNRVFRGVMRHTAEGITKLLHESEEEESLESDSGGSEGAIPELDHIWKQLVIGKVHMFDYVWSLMDALPLWWCVWVAKCLTYEQILSPFKICVIFVYLCYLCLSLSLIVSIVFNCGYLFVDAICMWSCPNWVDQFDQLWALPFLADFEMSGDGATWSLPKCTQEWSVIIDTKVVQSHWPGRGWEDREDVAARGRSVQILP